MDERHRVYFPQNSSEPGRLVYWGCISAKGGGDGRDGWVVAPTADPNIQPGSLRLFSVKNLGGVGGPEEASVVLEPLWSSSRSKFTSSPAKTNTRSEDP